MTALDKLSVRISISSTYTATLLINRTFYLSGQGRVAERNHRNKHSAKADLSGHPTEADRQSIPYHQISAISSLS